MRLSQVMRAEGLEPERSTLILHRPKPPGLRRLLPWIAAEQPEVFDAYQSVHSRPAQATLRGRPVTLSFVTVGEGRLAFAGAFAVAIAGERPLWEIYADPRFEMLRREREATHGLVHDDEDDEAAAARREDLRLVFRLDPLAAMSDLKWRLIVPASGTRAYVRLAESFDPHILAIAEASLLAPAAPEWRDLLLTAAEVRTLPQAWATRLAEWRGIYLIVDEADGARYVGSAYGAENLLGRWRAHVAGDRGITAELRRRRTEGFRFSILERLSPDTPPEAVIRLEQTWMDRLHSRRFGLNTGERP
jgi:hypothetical protein